MSASARSVRVAMVAAAAMAPVALAGLRAEPVRCSDHTCAPHQYCSRTINTCADCSQICHSETKNYQRDTCHESCQDYLHDLRYQSKGDSLDVSDGMIRLEGDLHRLTIMVSVMFCLFIVCFIGLTVYACSSYRKACRRRKTADIESNNIELKKIGAKIANGITVGAPAGATINRSSAVAPMASGGPPSLSFSAKPSEEVKMRPRSFSRHPSEDTCPGDYSVVYDSPAPGWSAAAAGASAGAGAVGGRPLSASAGSVPPPSRHSMVGSGAGSAPVSARSESRRTREVDITDMTTSTTVGIL